MPHTAAKHGRALAATHRHESMTSRGHPCLGLGGVESCSQNEGMQRASPKAMAEFRIAKWHVLPDGPSTQV